MAVTVTDTRTILTDGVNQADADNVTPWSGDATPTLTTSTTEIAETTGAIAMQLNIAEGSLWYNCSSTDLSDSLIYVWFSNTAIRCGWKDTTAVNTNGGGFGTAAGLYVSDGTNTVVFYMSGYDRRVFSHSDALPVQYECLVFDPTSTIDSSEYRVLAGTFGSLSWSAITDVGVYFETLSKALGGGYNTFVDIIRYGNNGLTITGGTTGDRGTFAEILADEVNYTTNENSFGIIREYSTGVYGLQGGLTFGETTSGDSWFQDTDVTLIFEDRIVENGRYFIDVVGVSGASDETHFILTNSTITTAGPSITVDCTDIGIDELTLTGNTIRTGGGTISFGTDSDAAGHTIENNTFDGCGQIDPGDVSFANNIVSNSAATDGALLISDTTQSFANTNFNSNTRAIEINTAGNYTFNGNTFTSNTYDVENSITDLTIDSYDLSNQDATQALGNGTTTGVAQSVTGDGNALGAAVFYLSKTGSPTGNATAYLYAHSGSFGTSSVPTGAALATSETFDVSTLTTTLQLVKFTFNSSYTPTNATNYVIALEYSGGDVSNYVNVGTDTSTPSHGGNFATEAGSWSAVSGTDAAFYLRTGWVVVNATNGANPGTLNYINSAGTFGTTSVYSYNANTTTYTDETTDINNATINDVALPPIQATTAGDAIYFGDTSTFTGVTIDVGTAGSYSDITLNWEYWNGSSWASLSDEVDETTSFTVAGTNTVNFSEPSDWFGTTVNSVHRFWIRAVSSHGASPVVTTAPLADQGWIGATEILTSVSLEINGVVQNTQCYIVPSAGGTVLMNEAAISLVSGDEYKATESVNYSGDTAVIVRAREMGYLPFETNATVSSNGLTVTAIWQVDPNWKLVVSGVNITFNENSPSDDTIVRASGSFVTDGWLDVMGQVTVEGSSSNDGTYEIQTVAATTLTLATTEDLTAEGPVSGVTLTFTRRAPTW